MNENYRTFFGFHKEPFCADIALKDILKTDQLDDVSARFDYVIRLGATGLVTGEIGSGKSTAIRYAESNLHPSEYQGIYVTAYNRILPASIERTRYLFEQQLKSHHASAD